MIKFTITGKPTPQKRARLSARHAYKDNVQALQEESFLARALPFAPPSPVAGALKVTLVFYMPRPKSKKLTDKPTGRPDLDNLVKHVLDCMIMGGFFLDDSQIVCLQCLKRFDENPRTEIKLEAVP